MSGNIPDIDEEANPSSDGNEAQEIPPIIDFIDKDRIVYPHESRRVKPVAEGATEDDKAFPLRKPMPKVITLKKRKTVVDDSNNKEEKSEDK